MKKQGFIKTGMLPIHKVSRKRVADAIRKARKEGELSKVVFNDAVVYQSNDKYNPYLYGTLI